MAPEGSAPRSGELAVRGRRRRPSGPGVLGPASGLGLVFALAWLGCGVSDSTQPSVPDPAPGPPAAARALQPLLVGNQLRDPGFEADGDGWMRFGLKKKGPPPFEIGNEFVHAGRAAAHLVVDWQPPAREKRVSVTAAAQEISPTRFPDRIGGWYRVESWENASDETDLHLQVVVIVIGDPRTRQLVWPDDPDRDPALNNYQLRYSLAGLTEPASRITNARVRLIRRGAPPLGRWVSFELPIRADFEELWGVVPADYEYLRVFFEVRFDNKEPGRALHADAYFDDLFVGFDDLPEP